MKHVKHTELKPTIILLPALIGLLAATLRLGADTPPPADLAPGEVQTILEFPEGNRPEGVAVDAEGNVYVGNRYFEGDVLIGDVLKLAPDGKCTVIATIAAPADDNAFGLLGLAVGSDGDVWAAAHTLDEETHGLWRISGGGKKAMLVPGSDQIDTPNAVTFDDGGNIYVTDSFVGAIWRFPPDAEGPAELWAQHELLEPFDFDPFGFPIPGANGIAFESPNRLYVANTEKGLVAVVTIGEDGQAEAVDLVAWDVLLLTIDGITIDSGGIIHGAIAGHGVLGTFPLIQLDPLTGDIVPTVTDEAEIAKFDFPLSVAGEGNILFVTNGALDLGGEPGPGPSVVGVGLEAGAP